MLAVYVIKILCTECILFLIKKIFQEQIVYPFKPLKRSQAVSFIFFILT